MSKYCERDGARVDGTPESLRVMDWAEVEGGGRECLGLVCFSGSAAGCLGLGLRGETGLKMDPRLISGWDLNA